MVVPGPLQPRSPPKPSRNPDSQTLGSKRSSWRGSPALVLAEGPREAERPLWESWAAGTPQAFAGSPGSARCGLPGQVVKGVGMRWRGRSWAWVRGSGLRAGLLTRPHPG